MGFKLGMTIAELVIELEKCIEDCLVNIEALRGEMSYIEFKSLLFNNSRELAHQRGYRHYDKTIKSLVIEVLK